MKNTLKTVCTAFFILVLLPVLLSTSPPKNKQKSFDTENMDAKVSPGVDFFQYANGGWIKRNPIPATQSRWGSFNELAEENKLILRAILEEAAADKTASAGTSRRMIGDF